MGAFPYWYFIPYQKDINQALQELRQRELMAGRYYPNIEYIDFPLNELEIKASEHGTIDEAVTAARDTGTRSILDLSFISHDPEFGAAQILPEDLYEEFFDTRFPTRRHIEESDALFDSIERGHGFCIEVYTDTVLNELCFIGYSYD